MNEPGNVPSHDVKWRVKFTESATVTKYKVVMSRSWFDARRQAMMHFCCGPDEVEVERV